MTGTALRRRSAATGRMIGDAIGQVPVAIYVMILIGLALRIAVWNAYSPAVLNLSDSASYVGVADGSLFGDPTRTAGYPLFLRAMHAVSEQLEFTIQVQHLLGIVTAVLLYATVRRLGGPIWAGGVASAAVLLPIDQIFLEHAVMNETLFTMLAAAAAYAAVRALDPPRQLWGPINERRLWIVLAGVMLAFAGWARSVGIPLVPLLALWFVVAIPGAWRSRIPRGALALVSAGVVIFGYALLQDAETGTFGLTRASGWATYARAAPFADCSQFEPPAGTERLCESSPVDARPGPDYYGHEPTSPARQIFGAPPNGNTELGEFGRSAIMAQPLSYLKVVARDFIRYFDPSFDPQDFSGVGYELLSIERRAGGVEDFVAGALNNYYVDDEYRIGGSVGTMADIQRVVRVHPLLLLVSFGIAVVGLFVASGRARWGILLLGGLGFVMLLIPPATVIWSSRYAIPAQGFIVAGGTLALWTVLHRLRTTRSAGDVSMSSRTHA
jgi:hypothetical protein